MWFSVSPLHASVYAILAKGASWGSIINKKWMIAAQDGKLTHGSSGTILQKKA